ncbi:tRNA(Met) cytidine acetate ligase [Saccharibacillus alkalitolerans]|uniref:tRNA(Met) cytidine acetate ligase n=1 Tax=Saccharibacillus alkalitolerans TaxID=2705290 RepID=A0ABX0FBY2_9BACL|nr:nucleotidyltransferase family protein [Saccharibacillus alkalitolerans]NGZ75552.1 nucleotidyltransferase family protein [Saccharibacillus alkalitolerans]
MKTVGLIVEYNPFHNGHLLHLERSLRVSGADASVAVMSGPFTQRGEPALLSKRARAEMALAAGVDLVLELPVLYALQPAEWFAFGGASLLDATGVVSSLCFGSESGEIAPLEELASRMQGGESPAMREALKQALAEGLSFPAAYAKAASGQGGGDSAAAAALLGNPNDMLGLHYVLALRRLASGITPLAVRREQAGYHDAGLPAGGSIASATAVRAALARGEGGPGEAAPYLPPSSLAVLRREALAGRMLADGWEALAQPLLTALITRSPEELALVPGMDEGLEHRIAAALPRLPVPGTEALLSAIKTKRYTRTRLQRLLAHALLNHRGPLFGRDSLARGPRYIRVLGFSPKGRQLLKTMKKTAKLPVVVRAADFDHPQLGLDIRAAAVHASAFPSPGIREMYADYYAPPVTEF